jgi:hypothetical protein
LQVFRATYKFCRVCQRENPQQANFCRLCGQPFGDGSPAPVGRTYGPWTWEDVFLVLCFGPVACLFPGFRRA